LHDVPGARNFEEFVTRIITLIVPLATSASAAVVRRRFGLSGLLLAAWMTLIPSVGLAQDCLQWADRTPLGTARPLTGAFSAQRLATNEETE
jgi:hypothetical protein